MCGVELGENLLVIYFKQRILSFYAKNIEKMNFLIYTDNKEKLYVERIKTYCRC